MSPLARSLLALACAALLHASSADLPPDMIERVRAELPNWNQRWPCGYLEMGIVEDKYIQKIELPAKLVPPQNLIYIENVAKPDQALVGQQLWVCDVLGRVLSVTLKPMSGNKHSPIEYICNPPITGGCYKGVIVFANQYVIKKLL